jgi:hypothetical protein
MPNKLNEPGEGAELSSCFLLEPHEPDVRFTDNFGVAA